MQRVIWGIVLALLLAPPLAAEGDRLQPDFSFRRVKPPAPGHQGPRITVQITPQAPQDQPLDAPEAPVASGGDWFWGPVPAEIGAPGAARLRQALHLIGTAPQGRALPRPRLQDLAQISGAHGRDLLRHSVGSRVSPALALAVIAVESGGDARAQSRAGAQGLMQLMPATAARFDVGDPFDPGANIRGGITYLDWLLGEFGGDAVLALAAYNAGEGHVREAGGVPEFAETRAYVPRVLAAWLVARGLCQTPPELLSDGCVFVGG